MRVRRYFFCLSLAGILTLAAGSAAAQESQTQEGLWNQLRQLHEKARESGGSVPGNLSDWVKQDLERAGSWEYRVATLAAGDAELEQALNALGKERWEVVWVQPQAQDLRVLLKRPARTHLQSVPMTDLLKLLPKSGQGGG